MVNGGIVQFKAWLAFLEVSGAEHDRLSSNRYQGKGLGHPSEAAMPVALRSSCLSYTSEA